MEYSCFLLFLWLTFANLEKKICNWIKSVSVYSVWEATLYIYGICTYVLVLDHIKNEVTKQQELNKEAARRIAGLLKEHEAKLKDLEDALKDADDTVKKANGQNGINARSLEDLLVRTNGPAANCHVFTSELLQLLRSASGLLTGVLDGYIEIKYIIKILPHNT